jgi:ESF2/ABP1 family protein
MNIAHEKAAREQRLRAEINQARKENKAYVDNVEASKKIKGIEDRKRKRVGHGSDDVSPLLTISCTQL